MKKLRLSLSTSALRLGVFAAAALGIFVGMSASVARAQTPSEIVPTPKQRPRIKGRAVKLKVDSSPQQATVYWDAGTLPAPRDYGVAGYTPLTLVVPNGNVRVILEMKGFRTQERDIAVDKPENLLLTMEKAAMPARLELVAGSDGNAAGAEVWIDGVARGTLPNAFEVPSGRHNLEVKKAGWKSLGRWLDLGDDEKRTLEVVLERSEQPPGTLLVTADAPGDVYVDGVRRDQAPAVITNLTPGEHVVEVRRERGTPWRQAVTITAGQQAKVNATLGGAATDDRGKSILRVQSTVPDAEVFLDGSTLGKAPIDRRDLPAGKHFVIIRKDGYEEYSREVYLLEGQPVSLVAELRNVGKVKFLSSPDGADVTIDGAPIGRTPIERDDVSAGDHVITMRLPGYEDSRETVTIVGGKERLVSFDLKPMSTGPTAEQVEQRKTSMSSFGARTLPTGGATADVAVGYPYILFARLTLGIFSKPGLGVDLGVELQSFFQMWQAALHSRVQFFEAGPFSLGARASGGVGTGANSKNTIFADVAALASLDFAGVMNVSADLRFSMWSDQFCPKMEDVVNHGVGQSDYCKDFAWADKTKYPELGGKDPGGQRFSGSRIYMGLTVAGAIDRRTSFFARLEFLPGAEIFRFPDERMAFKDSYNSIMLQHDPLYYGTVGLSFKF